jgi:Chaperone of endosialidase
VKHYSGTKKRRIVNPINQLKKTTSVFLVALLLASIAIPWSAQAVSPPPDGGYPNGNTAEGDFALQHLTTGTFNTALGAFALFNNTAGLQNTATGAGALFSNTTGFNNTANGAGALFNNIDGKANTAIGFSALSSNTTISGNVGNHNTAIGNTALASNTIGNANTAVGSQALLNNVEANANTAVGEDALFSSTGFENTALGHDAGFLITTGSNNIDIGNAGNAADSATIRIGDADQTATFIAGISGANVAGGDPVFILSNGKLGTVNPPSSARFKEEIKPMNQASEVILALKPVTFRYKKEFDAARIPQFGLVAEEVEKVNPDLVKRDRDGKVQTVRYEAVNAMLLNEFLKEHHQVQGLKAIVAKQQKQIERLTAGLQKVSAQIEMNKPAPQTVLNNQ